MMTQLKSEDADFLDQHVTTIGFRTIWIDALEAKAETVDPFAIRMYLSVKCDTP